MKTFIRVTEIWVPTKDRQHLEFFDGLYGEHEAFKGASQDMRFGFDEGLPGKAWAARRPIILHTFENSYFLRTEAARQAGLTCGVALPIFAGDILTAVIVFFCGDDESLVGAIELWRNTPAESFDMGLEDGYYGTAETFEWTSKHTKFRPGFGLPGIVWQSGMPQIMENIVGSQRFLRRDSAVKIGLSKGFGLPCSVDSKDVYVMTFLSALGSPIARRFEIWTSVDEGKTLRFDSGHCDQVEALAAAHGEARIERWQGALGESWMTGVPTVRADFSGQANAAEALAVQSGLNALVAVPILQEGRVRAVVAWYF